MKRREAVGLSSLSARQLEPPLAVALSWMWGGRMIVLGPAVCQGCRRLVTWNGWEWQDASGLHRCMARVLRARHARLTDNTGAGDGCVSVPYALTPVPRPSPDEPGSSASIEVMAR